MLRKTKFVLGISLVALLAVGQAALAEEPNKDIPSMGNMGSMMKMMSDSNMQEMMSNPNVKKMMENMNTPEGKAMIVKCVSHMNSDSSK